MAAPGEAVRPLLHRPLRAVQVLVEGVVVLLAEDHGERRLRAAPRGAALTRRARPAAPSRGEHLQVVAEVLLAHDGLGAAEAEGEGDLEVGHRIEARVGGNGADDAQWVAARTDECEVAMHKLRAGRVAVEIVTVHPENGGNINIATFAGIPEDWNLEPVIER